MDLDLGAHSMHNSEHNPGTPQKRETGMAMGELAVGLAKSVMEGALTRAQLAIEEESNLRQSTMRDLVFMTGEFQMMHSFLSVVYREEAVTEVVKTWARLVRELAEDSEDCIELLVSSESRPTWWWRMLPSCTAAMLPVELMAAEIGHLKSRAEDLAMANARYSIITDSGSGSKTSTRTAATAFDMLSEARKTTTRQGFADLTQLISQKDDGDHIIAVWGTGGDLGTTSAMRKAYNDPEIFQKFTCRAWVKLVHLFDPHEFIRELTAQFYASSEELNSEAIRGFLTISEGATQGDYLKEFLLHVKEVKYLVVLEDLSGPGEWGAIREVLPDTKNGSWIIVSTQQFELASLCVGHPFQALELKQFSTDHSVCAFAEGSQGYGDKAEEILETNAAIDWMMKYPIIGRELEIRELCQSITSARFKCFQVISVWGIAGVGKSALIKNIFCDRMIRSGPFQKFGWVDVSHPFDLREFSRSLILNFRSESLQASDKIRIKNPIQECRDFLEQHHCLLIFDDLHSTEEWDLIKSAALSKYSTSIVIAITNEESIAKYCADKDGLIFNVKGLQDDAAFDLFHQEVSRKNPWSPLKDLKEDTKLLELIVKCGGLPKVIVEIAGILAQKTNTVMDTICSTTDRFMQTLETNPEYHSLRGLFGWMYSYFCTCPDSLKPCILYMSFFPQDRSIRRRRVVRRWVAEGYSKDSRINSAEEKGEIFFAKLLDMNIIQHPPQLATTLFGETRITLCKLNGFIREYIISRGTEENFVSELGTRCNLITQRTGPHLIIRESWHRDQIVFESMDFSRLRSLTVYGRWESFFISKSTILLRVLDLEDASGVKDEDLKDMMKLLSCLKFLSLRGCRDVYSLPSSLGDLRLLQTLDIRNTPIVSLPATIIKLQKLQYIRAGTSVTREELSTPRISLSWIRRRRCVVGVEVPARIYKLTSLHTFGVVNIGESGGFTMLKELENLTQLRKLGVSGINRKNSMRFFSAISGHVHLESLSVQLDKESQNCLAGILLPSKSLQSLKLLGPVHSLPAYKTYQLIKLTKLNLEMTTFAQNDIELIGSLPKLHTLRIRVSLPRDAEVRFCVYVNGLEASSYEQVKVLEIASTSNIHITFGSQTMGNLELLKAHCCNGSSVKLSGMGNLPVLKEVFLKGCCDDELKEDMHRQLTVHPMRPVLKLDD